MSRQVSDNFPFPGMVVPESTPRGTSLPEEVNYLAHCIEELAKQVDALEERVKALEEA